MKRSRAESITGGSGDVNPQWMTLPVINLSAPNTFTSLQIPLPISRLPTKQGKAMVIEVLKVLLDWPAPSPGFLSTGGQTIIYYFQLTTARATQIIAGDPSAFAHFDLYIRGVSAGVNPQYVYMYEDPRILDLTDGAGHGILIATDSIWAAAETTNYQGALGAGPFSCRILYRFKEISLPEYIGIVQSQQSVTNWTTFLHFTNECVRIIWRCISN